MTGSRIAPLLLVGAICAASPAVAQPDPRTDWSGYSNWCLGQGGWPYKDYRGVGCDMTYAPKPKPKPQPQPGQTQTGPSTDETEETRRQQQEEERRRKRAAALQELMQRERQSLEQDRQRFEQEKHEAVGQLKGAGPTGGETRESEPEPHGTKGVLIEKGHKGSAPPYLADLDPKHPLVVDPTKVQGRSPEALRTANRRTHLVLDALEAGRGSWEASLRFLADRRLQYPNDAAVRDAHAYVWGLYRGFLGATKSADRYYRYGVREWLDGDYEGAARAFARAAANNPDDKAAYATYAETLGLLHGRGDCRKPEDCRGVGALPRPDLFTPDDERRLKALHEVVRRDPYDVQQRVAFGVLQGWVAYGDWVTAAPGKPKPPLDAEQRRHVAAGLEQLTAGDYAAAMQSFGAAYLRATARGVDDRGLIFVTRYVEGVTTGMRGGDVIKAFDERARPVIRQFTRSILADIQAEEQQRLLASLEPAPRDRKALERARQEMLDPESRNPFFGVLPDKEVEALNLGKPPGSAKSATKAQ